MNEKLLKRAFEEELKGIEEASTVTELANIMIKIENDRHQAKLAFYQRMKELSCDEFVDEDALEGVEDELKGVFEDE